MSDNPHSSQVRKLSAIMFSDIVGFSRQMGENEQGTMRMLDQHNAIMQKYISQYKGTIVKTTGDGIMASYDSAVNAVRGAIDIQRAFRKHNQSLPEENHILVRIGIHLGDVVIKGNDLFGEGVNIASRIEPLADAGGICISQDVFNQVRNKIEIESIHIGPHDLKNISEKVDLYRLVLDAHDSKVRTTNTARQAPPLPLLITIAAVVLLLLGTFAMMKGKNNPNQPANDDQEIVSEDAESPDGDGTDTSSKPTADDDSAATDTAAKRIQSLAVLPFHMKAIDESVLRLQQQRNKDKSKIMKRLNDKRDEFNASNDPAQLCEVIKQDMEKHLSIPITTLPEHPDVTERIRTDRLLQASDTDLRVGLQKICRLMKVDAVLGGAIEVKKAHFNRLRNKETAIQISVIVHWLLIMPDGQVLKKGKFETHLELDHNNKEKLEAIRKDVVSAAIQSIQAANETK